MNFVEELRWRGMLQDIMPGTEELLSKEQVTAYLGIDPTADSLHIGHLCGVMILRHFQRCGHKPLALIGGATGMIGDPSGKSAERNLLNEETLRHNQACIKKQLAKFLDFESDVPNRAELVNNYDWMKDFTFLDFAREVGKHITVNYMMAKDSVKRRLNGEARDGLSFTEFTYQLLQGYDFLHLYETKGCKLQMGGSDPVSYTHLDVYKRQEFCCICKLNSAMIICVFCFMWNDRKRKKHYIALQHELTQKRVDTMLLKEEELSESNKEHIDKKRSELTEQQIQLCISVLKTTAVSYTHLDVYKRQLLVLHTANGSPETACQ